MAKLPLITESGEFIKELKQDELEELRRRGLAVGPKSSTRLPYDRFFVLKARVPDVMPEPEACIPRRTLRREDLPRAETNFTYSRNGNVFQHSAKHCQQFAKSKLTLAFLEHVEPILKDCL